MDDSKMDKIQDIKTLQKILIVVAIEYHKRI